MKRTILTVTVLVLCAGAVFAQKFTGHTDTVWSVSFSPDGKQALSGSADKTIKLWDVATGMEIK